MVLRASRRLVGATSSSPSSDEGTSSHRIPRTLQGRDVTGSRPPNVSQVDGGLELNS